jgi:hypothetical protein
MNMNMPATKDNNHVQNNDEIVTAHRTGLTLNHDRTIVQNKSQGHCILRSQPAAHSL